MVKTIEVVSEVSKVAGVRPWAGIFVVEIQEDILADEFTFEALMRTLPLASQARILNKNRFTINVQVYVTSCCSCLAAL